MKNSNQAQGMNSNLKLMILSGLFAALTAIGSFIKIPVPPAAFTLQIFFVILAGVLLGSKFGAISQIVYILIGLVGAPVFAGGCGFSYVLKPTFGYVIGFIPAAFIAGYFVEKSKLKHEYLKYVIAALLGLLVTYVIGVPYLYYNFNFITNKGITINNALKFGLFLYLPWDIIKALCVGLVAKKIPKSLLK